MAEATGEDGRDRGILSKADREFLRGEKTELSDQGERDTRYRIRNRIEDGILDFRLLSDELESNDRELVFQQLDADVLVHVIRFLYLGLLDVSESLDSAIETYEDIIEAAILPVYSYYDTEHIVEDVDAQIVIEKTRPDLEELKARYRRGEESLDEVRFLMQTDDFEGDETLLSARLLKHMHESGELPEGLGETLLESTDFDTLDDYFAAADEQIAQSGDEDEDDGGSE